MRNDTAGMARLSIDRRQNGRRRPGMMEGDEKQREVFDAYATPQPCSPVASAKYLAGEVRDMIGLS
jgi:hypothetical protein